VKGREGVGVSCLAAGGDAAGPGRLIITVLATRGPECCAAAAVHATTWGGTVALVPHPQRINAITIIPAPHYG
jgi:hypothetical protein